MLELKDRQEYSDYMKEINPYKKRERSLAVYEGLLNLDITNLAIKIAKKQKTFVWYDMCCGEAKALLELQRKLFWEKPVLYKRTHFIGVDVDVDDFHSSHLSFIKQDVRDIQIRKPNLITCLFGLMYLERHAQEGRETVVNWYNQSPMGTIIACDLELRMKTDFKDFLVETLKDSFIYGEGKYRNETVNYGLITKTSNETIVYQRPVT